MVNFLRCFLSMSFVFGCVLCVCLGIVPCCWEAFLGVEGLSFVGALHDDGCSLL